MTSAEYEAIADTMVRRSRQWTMRLFIAALVAAVSFPLTSWSFALGWFLVYGLLQVFESQLHPQGRLAERLSRGAYVVLCLIQTVLNNVVFSAYGAVEIMSGSMLALVCGTLLIGGVTVNTVMVSPGSRSMITVAIIPQVGYALLVPFGALNVGLSYADTAQITFAAVMLLVSGLMIRSYISRLFAETLEARAQAEQANLAKSQFLATMSHEIRTPLNGVLGMAQAMTADELPAHQRARLETITQSGESLLHILGDVLDLAKVEAGKLALEETAFDLDDLVDRSQAAFRVVAQAKGLNLDVQVAESARGGWSGDPTRIRQILTNLISNAVKFTETGVVTVRANANQGELVLSVADTGPGVAPEQLPALFQKFSQADTSTTRRYGGTGLGLSICQELVQLMGGDIEVRHVVPHGLAFDVRLPLRRAEAPLVRSKLAADVAPFDGHGVRVLAAEDHPVNRQVLALLLSQVGIVPTFVENGAQALEAWRAEDWDLILMDVQMPVMDGPTAAAAIRAEETATGRDRTPIIALTANVMAQQIESYHAAGMEIAVAKPIEAAVLFDAIATTQAARAA
ncbi:MAG: response regulator [Caulobacterales bacterium]|nr:response regulator [Caulobacterales bacterium]